MSSVQSPASLAFAQDSLKRAVAVCFDVDSTVITHEGIDLLAEFKGVGKEVADITKKLDFSKK